jgi:uncharacterized Fe-S cluster-containing radical SAM superfamily protein
LVGVLEVTKCDHLQSLRFSGQLPLVFTEHGAVMLASILNSKRAVEINIRIVRIYIRMREALSTHKDVLLRIEEMEKRLGKNDQKVEALMDYLNRFLAGQQASRKAIGYKIGAKKKK